MSFLFLSLLAWVGGSSSSSSSLVGLARDWLNLGIGGVADFRSSAAGKRCRRAGRRLQRLFPLRKTPAQRAPPAVLRGRKYGGAEPDASPTFAVRDQDPKARTGTSARQRVSLERRFEEAVGVGGPRPYPSQFHFLCVRLLL
ncbi:hypothetical protein lerEdw1_011393 [Lerista edwardsae]|nr:hypothetical protein lerEdw1_011393 [Lerista edwardsae]